MYQRATRPASIFCIVPPHILRAIVQSGTPQQRAVAMKTLAIDHTFRTLRVQHLMAASTVRRRPAVLTAVEGQKQRTIFDAHHTQTLPGDVVRAEGAPPTDNPAVNEAYDGLGATFDFYWNIFERNSIDDEGLPLNATVHFDQNFDNAY